ncbi:MAG: hypothetical protein C0616_00365 [Desulfuromonas sp.]|nr:MAG: hypothetical protein C0616_00365 [Desulfuromonas sp.]
MDLLLQAWGGGFYLLNKIFFSLAEGKGAGAKRTLRLWGWSIYILGVPAWVLILVDKHDWIAAAIEAGGVPAMLLGLYNVWQQERPGLQQVFDRAARFCTYVALLLGLGASLIDYGGLTSLSQLLEIGVMIGFLLGSYLLAKNKLSGWLCFMLMNASMATLMLIQHKPLLTLQQLVSLCFVLYGYGMARKRSS